MELVLYKTQDSENVINKDLTEVTKFNIKMKKDVDIVMPILLLNDKGVYKFKECNYCYIEEFERYYFIRSIENVTNTIWKFYLECDVLESYKKEILDSVCSYKRNILEGDYQNISADVDVRKNISIYESDVALSSEKNIIITTIGG